MLNLIDEFTRECLAIRISRKLQSTDVIDVLADQFILRGGPSHIRSDSGPEFVATAVRDWIRAVGAQTAYIEPGCHVSERAAYSSTTTQDVLWPPTVIQAEPQSWVEIGA